MSAHAIGVRIRSEPDALRATLSSLRAHTAPPHDLVLLPDGPDAATRAALARLPALPQLATAERRGAAACFNRLASWNDAPAVVFLEAGVVVGPGWLERLLAALAADPASGLAGPSTNRAWNEQGAFPEAGGRPGEVAATARLAAERFGAEARSLAPLHSLGAFCFAVQRRVVERVGGADEGYGLGPCWEMDYAARAARAGLRSVWACGAYVWRPPVAERARAEEAALFEASKRRYQDRFCARRRREPGFAYEAHCLGDACPDFAPPGAVEPFLAIPRPPAPAAPATSPPAARAAAAPHEGPPLVSCIMPTSGRRRFVPAAIRAFLRQDYEPRELVVVDDGPDPVRDLVPDDPRIRYIGLERRTALGAKRNLACEAARGPIVAHWDDDDWHAPWRLSYQVSELLAAGADLCGLDRLWFYDAGRDRAWQYRYRGRGRWVAGGTFCFRRRLWERQGFAPVTVGEDTRFVRGADPGRVLVLPRDDFYVARIHAGNTDPKRTAGPSWLPSPTEVVRRILGEDFDAFAGPPAAPAADPPLVSCVMPTYDRAAFLPLALRHFEAQRWTRKELVVVDDSPEPVEHLIRGRPGVRYLRCPRRLTVGAKRSLGAREARGSVIVQWDDDDWFSPDRIHRQVQPIVDGRADLSGLVLRYVLEIETGTLWQPRAAALGRLCALGLAAGTLAFRRELLDRGVGYPNVNVGEDVAFLNRSLRARQRLHRIEGDLFVCVRHGRNTWQFRPGQSPGWDRIELARAPLPVDLLALYRGAAARAQEASRRAL